MFEGFIINPIIDAIDNKAVGGPFVVIYNNTI